MTTPTTTSDAVSVQIIPLTDGAPSGKLAEAELHFERGPLAGLKLVGFTIWASRRDGEPNVTLPARPYRVNGERRHYTLLRSTGDVEARQVVQDLILAAYRREAVPA